MYETCQYDDGTGFTTDATIEVVKNDIGDTISITTETTIDAHHLNYITFLDESEFKKFLRMLVRFDEQWQ